MYVYNTVMLSSQPDVSKYSADLMPLLLNYLSSLNRAKIGHVTKAFYALENFMENLGTIIDAVLNECPRLSENPNYLASKSLKKQPGRR